MKIYIKCNIDNSSIDTIRKQLFLYYGMLKDEFTEFFNEYDNVTYQEDLDDMKRPELWHKIYDKYLPFAKKCKEIKTNIRKDVTGHVIDQTIRYEMYNMASEVLLGFYDVVKNAEIQTTSRAEVRR
jgi:hypothetical protein